MDEEQWFAADCVRCDEPVGERGEHINHVYMAKKAEWDAPVAGNVAFGIPAIYAITLLCDVCVEETHVDRTYDDDYDSDDDSDDGLNLEYAIRVDDDGEIERVPVDELEDLPPMREVIEGEAELDLGPEDVQEGFR